MLAPAPPPRAHPAVLAGGVAVLVVALALLAAQAPPTFRPDEAAGAREDTDTDSDPDADPSSLPVVRVSPRRKASVPPPFVRRPRLTDEQRSKGLNECATPDPGEGSLRPKKAFSWGTIQLPKSGGHTGDFGYDVIVHFHGADGVRKALAPLGTGLVLVGVDRGEGSAAYEPLFPAPAAFDGLRRSITSALVAESGSADAHIRHLALSSWSAGYGATVALLRHVGDADVDAIVLLDSLHASYAPDARTKPSGPDAIYAPSLAPVLAFAERAKRGEKAFFLTHSHIVPPGYPSTTEVAQLLVRKLGLTRLAAPPEDDPFGLLTYTDSRTVQIRSFRGANELAHCTHLSYFADAVMDLLVPRWGTPALQTAIAP